MQDRGMNRLLQEGGKIKPNRRPDVTYRTKDGKIHQIEVQSKSDVEWFRENPMAAKGYFIDMLNRKTQYEIFKTKIDKIPPHILETLIEMILSRSSFHQEQCDEIKKMIQKT